MHSASFDTSLFSLINKGFNHRVLDALMVFFSLRYQYVLMGVLVLLLIFEKKRSNVLIALAAALFSFALADWLGNELKHLIARPRPCQVMDVRLLVGCGKSFSFPSNHAANAFALAIPFMVLVRSRLKSLMLVTAFLVSISRIYVGVHYPSDVLGGIILGTMAGIAMSAIAVRAQGTDSKPRLIGFFLLAVTAFRYYYILHGNLQLSPDEAHYWEWSRRLDIGYYSKGPVIAYLIRAGTLIFGNTELGIRFFAPILSALGSVFLYRLGKLLYDEEVGFYSAVLFQVIPLFSAFGIIMTIDAPFLFFWIFSLLFFYSAVTLGTLTEWLLLGVVAGLGLLTKFTMGFFYISALLYLLSSREDRRELFSARPYLAGFISLLLMAPLVLWNIENDFVMIKHNIGHTHISDGFRISGQSFLEFLGSQTGVVTPILLIFMLYALFKQMREDKFSFFFAVPTLAFFLLKSIQGKVEANWAMSAYITCLFAFSSIFLKEVKYSKPVVKVLVAEAIFLALSVTALGLYPGILRLPPDLDPSARLRGWKEFAGEVDKVKADMGGDPFIFSDKYQVSSELAFYMKGNPVTYCVNLGRRMNQYDLWPGFYDFKKRSAIFATIGDKDVPEKIKNAFASCGKETFTVYESKKPLRVYSIFPCYGFKGMKQEEAGSF